MARDDFFVKIRNPRQTRKSILENTRDVLRVLQGYEDYKKIRERRSHLINTFNNNLDEVKAMVSELKRLLPKLNIKEPKKTLAQRIETVEKPGKELKRIEQELADIEEKLSSI